MLLPHLGFPMLRRQKKDQFSIPMHHRYQVRPLSSGGQEREQPSGEPPFRSSVEGEKQEEMDHSLQADAGGTVRVDNG